MQRTHSVPKVRALWTALGAQTERRRQAQDRVASLHDLLAQRKQKLAGGTHRRMRRQGPDVPADLVAVGAPAGMEGGPCRLDLAETQARRQGFARRREQLRFSREQLEHQRQALANNLRSLQDNRYGTCSSRERSRRRRH